MAGILDWVQQRSGNVADIGKSFLDYVSGNEPSPSEQQRTSNRQQFQAQPGTTPYTYDPNTGLPYGIVTGPALHPAPLSDLPAALAAQQSLPGGQAPSTGTQTQTTDPTTGYPALINPLAVNAFFASAIAPMLNQMLQGLGERNAGLAQQAQQNLNQSQMPAQYRALFQQQIPRMQSEQNDLMTALGAAATTGPTLDLFMNQVNAARQQAAQSYMKQLYNEQTGSANNLSNLAALIGGQQTTPTAPTPTSAQALQTAIQNIGSAGG